MSRSKRYKRSSNRGAKILTTIFSIVIVLSVVLSLVGSFATRGSSQPTPTPTFLYPTFTPFGDPTPTPTASVPTLSVATPTSP